MDLRTNHSILQGESERRGPNVQSGVPQKVQTYKYQVSFPGGRGTARMVHVESWIRQLTYLFTEVLCGPIFEAQASVVVGSKRSKLGIMTDRDKRRRMKNGGGRHKPSP